MQARRERLRAQGMRPIQLWVPDLRDARIRAAIRREAALLAQHPENAVLDDWLDAMQEPSDWP
ncbi:antitoxin MazE family protein [Xanthobacteraceae bacterium Astr-EGSB]|uniref:antitoxin MazE family protein n=1 Tax=Astrobacterium formosum TaxID=3069710 RepID=UPI0027B6215B|nr:antitoxin MazE family protein [Xanthobacteraceae bacterium Astr-EGSB]